MKKFEDLVVNFDDIMYYFYEWEDNDKIEYIKEIPIIKLSKSNFQTILKYHIELESNFLEKIKNKTIINKDNVTALLLTDSHNAIVLEFDDNGRDIAISTLGVADELDVCEESIENNIEKIEYKTLNKRIFNSIGRKDKYICNFIRIELNELYANKEYSKLNYFYKELFHKDSKGIEESFKELKKSLSKIKKEHYYLYELMLLAHKKSGLSN